MTRSLLLIATTLLTSGAVAFGAPAASTASAPASASAPAGKWRCYIRCDKPAIVAAGTEAIFFRCGAGLWRYDVKTQTTRQLTPIDGVSLTPGGRCTLGPDGTLAIAGRNDPCLWPPSGQASILKVPEDGDAKSLMFGSSGEIWAFTPNKAYRLEGGWKLVGDAPGNELVARLGSKWLMYRGGIGPRPNGTFFLVDDTMTNIAPYQPKASESLTSFLRLGEQLFGIFAKAPATSDEPQEFVLARMTETTVTDLVVGHAVGASFDGKTFLKLTIVKSDGQDRICQVETSDGKRPAPLTITSAAWEFRPTLFQDANGHIWVDNRRWDGRAWKTFAPPDAFPYSSTSLALGDRLELSPQMKWQAIGGDATAMDNPSYDLKTRQACVCEAKDNGWTLKQVQFDTSGTKTLRSVDLPEPLIGQPVLDGDGRWWWATASKAYCLKPDGSVPFYAARIGAEMPDNILPSVAVSPSGTLWLMHAERYWGRYDPKIDRFVKDYPYDDYSFDVGTWKLSAPPPLAGELTRTLYRKNNDRWEPFASPFGVGDLRVTGRCRQAGRLLVTCWQGAFEYDSSSDSWVCLSDRPHLIAAFDSAGRRVLAANDDTGFVFVFDGDPCAAGGCDPALVERFAAVLKRLSDDDYQVRTKASQELQELAAKSSGLVRGALKNLDLPAETRDRLESIVKDLPWYDTLSQQNLFNRMHPPLVPKQE